MTPAHRHLPRMLIAQAVAWGLALSSAAAQPAVSPRPAPDSAGRVPASNRAAGAVPNVEPRGPSGHARTAPGATTIPVAVGRAGGLAPTAGAEPLPPAVAPAGVTPAASVPAERQTIKLRPPRDRADGEPDGPASGTLRPRAGSSLGSLLTMSSSLAMVLGLFFVAAWLFRKQGVSGAGTLPKEVVEVLGRTSLPGRQHLQLIRCGSKLLLVSVTPGGAETLTEISDPSEVERLAGLCRRGRSDSSTASFRQVLDDWGRQPHAAGFLSTEPDESNSSGRRRPAREASRA